MPAKLAFWDTSAIIPLYCAQVASRESRQIRRNFNGLVVWWGTHVEVHSGLNRLFREKVITGIQLTASLSKWERVRSSSRLIQPDEYVLRLAVSLTDDCGLRALDAFQLAAGLVWCREKPRNRPFVCADKRLSDAASGVGFDTIQIV